MQDLSQYAKRTHVEIHSKYISFIIVVSAALVGLVFAMGVLVGSRHAGSGERPARDALAVLDVRSKEPAPPEVVEHVNLSFHNSLVKTASEVPTPASLFSDTGVLPKTEGDGKEAQTESPPVRPRMAESRVPESLSNDEPGIYSLQVGSFQDKREANEMVHNLQKAGYAVFLVSVQMPDRGGIWYRVRVGPFRSKQEVSDKKRVFEERERLPAFIVKKSAKG